MSDPTVMGSEGQDARQNNKRIEAPRLTPDTDKYQYRCGVRMWKQRARAFANGGDSRAKGVRNGLGHTLYAAMDVTYRKVIEAEVNDKQLVLTLEDDEQVVTFNKQKNRAGHDEAGCKGFYYGCRTKADTSRPQRV